MQTQRQASLTKMLLHIEAQSQPLHPGHGFLMLRQLCGQLDYIRQHYPDDPALAGALLADKMPAVCGLASHILYWGRAVNDADPADLPEKGARCHAS